MLCGWCVGKLSGGGEREHCEEAGGEQAGLERQQLGLLVVVDEGRRGGLVEAGLLRGGCDLVGADEVQAGSGSDADLLETSALIRWSDSTLDTNAPVRPARTMAPIRATPSDEPSCCPVYCRPPASPRPEASTEDCTTLPSWEAISPIPTPSTAIETAKPMSARSGCTVASSATDADDGGDQAGLHDRPHGVSGREPRADVRRR